jgi:predicted DNA binding CopG/RHH family protein
VSQTPKSDKSKDDATERFQRGLRESGEAAQAQIEAELAEAGERERRGHATRPARARGRTTPIAVRFDEFTIKRLKQLAARRNTGYQTLLKEFVIERLYEEEKREGIV